MAISSALRWKFCPKANPQWQTNKMIYKPNLCMYADSMAKNIPNEL